MVVDATVWQEARPLSAQALEALRLRMIFDCCKWDPQVGDQGALWSAPLVLEARAWREVVELAETMAGEFGRVERWLLGRPDWWRGLGLPRGLRRALRRVAMGKESASACLARLMRFDFHWTSEGWRVSECNADVPGGLIEGSGLSGLMAEQYPGLRPVGDPAGAIARAMMERGDVAGGGTAKTFGLVHATAYTDDRQVMEYLGRRLAEIGGRFLMLGPDAVRWRDGRAMATTHEGEVALAGIARFFPAEWLVNLPRRSDWRYYFHGSRTPLCNPGAAVLVQSKRLGVVLGEARRGDADVPATPVWDRLSGYSLGGIPRAIDESWVLKPAMGRMGEGVGMAGVTEAKVMRRIVKAARRWPGHWVAQKRFATAAVGGATGAAYPCLGVFTLDGRVIGAYGRVARIPLVDGRAQDAAVLVAGEAELNVAGVVKADGGREVSAA
ncbi:MAG: glutathionylspermidine synthase family protein [Phycisphaeraceae bacterium]|nr:glutathionylspermidine synthase family protein [Phycisphaeraceae bacterium]